MKHLTLDDFALFCQLATAPSLSAVARQREVTASQVSRSLARIEAACGLSLIHRSTHSLSLTDEGEVFLAYAQRFIAEHNGLQDSLGQRRNSVCGVVRISISQLFAERILIPRIQGLQTLHPNLAIDLHLADRLVSMADEAMDLAVRAGAAPADTAIARLLGTHGRALYASPAYLKKHGVPRTPADLASHRLVSNTVSSTHNQWTFKVEGVTRTLQASGQLRVNSSAAVVASALAGAGIARINDVVGRQLVDEGRLKPVLARYTVAGEYSLHAVILAERNRAPKIRAALDYLVACFADFRSDAARGT